MDIGSVYKMCADGVIPSIRVGEKAIRIPRAAFEVYLNRAERGHPLLDEARTRPRTPPAAVKGDPGWLEAWQELRDLHTSKAADYGSDGDALANYVLTSEAVGEPDEYTAWLRIHEKTVRALNMIRSGRADECDEGLDVAALALAAEALRRRRGMKT